MVNTNNLHKQQYCRTHGALNNNKKMSVVISSMKMTFGGRTCHVEEIWRKQRGCRSLPFLFSMGIPNVTQRNESENQSDKKVIWQKKMTSRVAARWQLEGHHLLPICHWITIGSETEGDLSG